MSVAYGKNVVLDSFSLDVEPGSVMALLGPSGSGKTTALRSVAGFVSPSAGRIFLGDREVTQLAPYERRVGMVVQQYALFPHMKVRDNIAFGLRAHKVSRAKINPRVEECLEMVGMAAYSLRYPRELSGGQQQRVAIARALANQPEVLLLDEPLSALDAQLRSGMLAELGRLHRELPDVSILYVTHDQIEALTLADRIAVMDQAKLVEVGDSRQLYERPSREFTASFLGNANVLPAVVTEGADRSGSHRVKVGSHDLTTCAVGEAHAPGDTALVCIRPYRVSLTQEGPDDNQLIGTVEEVQWRGESYRIYLNIDGQLFKFDAMLNAVSPQIGNSVSVYFGTEDTLLIRKGNA